VSLQPAYDDSSITWDPTLVGTWKNEDDETALDIEAAEWHSYKVVVHSAHDTFTLTGHLTQAGDRTLLDVMPHAGVDSAALLLPVHAVFRVEHAGDGLDVAALDYDQLRLRVVNGDFSIGVLDERKNVVITGDTAQFRAWLKQTGAKGPVFAEPVHLTRAAQAG
jgi:hypothetical protein